MLYLLIEFPLDELIYYHQGLIFLSLNTTAEANLSPDGSPVTIKTFFILY